MTHSLDSCLTAKNMRLKALAEIYAKRSFAQLCNLNFVKIENFAKMVGNFAKFLKKLLNFLNIFKAKF